MPYTADMIVRELNQMNPAVKMYDGLFILPRSHTTCAADVLAIPTTHGYVAKTTGGDGEELTLANGRPGQTLVIQLVTDGGGDGTLTPAKATGFVSVVLADAGDTVVLHYLSHEKGWIIISKWNAAAAPVVNLS